MVHRMDLQRPQINLIKPTDSIQRKSQITSETIRGTDFGSVLRQEIDSKELKFSGHAKMRMQAGNITLTPNEKMRLSNAVSLAEEKGAKESLILMDKLALVVSIKNKTVITAIDEKRMKENVFTNIDSAVIV